MDSNTIKLRRSSITRQRLAGWSWVELSKYWGYSKVQLKMILAGKDPDATVAAGGGNGPTA